MGSSSAQHVPTSPPTAPTAVDDVAGEIVVALESVGKRFGANQALQDIDLRLEAGTTVSLLGLSGSGKSTLLRLLNGMHRPTSGAVTVLGEDIGSAGERRLRRVRRDIGMVFQQFHLVGPMSALENVCTGALGSLRGPRFGLWSYPRQVRERALDQLERVGLADQRFQRADTLSGGQQQRVAVARALVQSPRLLLADEPVASLDPESSHQVMRLITDIAKEDDITVICSLHQLEIAIEWADVVVGLRAGRKVMDQVTAGLDHEGAMSIYRSVAQVEEATDGWKGAA